MLLEEVTQATCGTECSCSPSRTHLTNFHLQQCALYPVVSAFPATFFLILFEAPGPAADRPSSSSISIVRGRTGKVYPATPPVSEAPQSCQNPATPATSSKQSTWNLKIQPSTFRKAPNHSPGPRSPPPLGVLPKQITNWGTQFNARPSS